MTRVAELGPGMGSSAVRKGCLLRRGYSNQMPSFAARVVPVGKPGIGTPGVVGNTAVAVAAAALTSQLAVACIPPVALPHIVPVGHMGRMRCIAPVTQEQHTTLSSSAVRWM